MLDILLPAFITGSLLALLSAPLGCLMVWRRMSFFSDSLSHGSMLGIALAAICHLPPWLGAISVALLVGFSVWYLHDRRLPTDAVLSMVASVLLCFSVILTTLNSDLRSQLFNMLLGDILLVSKSDILWLAAIIPICLGFVLYNWRAQILCALDEELAASNKINPRKQMALFIIILAIFCVAGLKSIGALLISATLVIPAITARLVSHSPQNMAIWALGLNIFAMALGLGLSAYVDVPAGPAVVVTMGAIFFIFFIGKKIVSKSSSSY